MENNIQIGTKKMALLFTTRAESINALYDIQYKVENQNLVFLKAKVYKRTEDKQMFIGTLKMESGKIKIDNFPFVTDVAVYIQDFVDIVQEIIKPKEDIS